MALIKIRRKRRNKYGAIKTRCLTKEHKPHDSKFEAMWCDKLLAMKQAKEIAFYDTQCRFNIGPNISHLVDFLIIHNDDSMEVIECKGVETQVWRMKKKLFCEKYPEIKYTVVSNKKRKERKRS